MNFLARLCGSEKNKIREDLNELREQQAEQERQQEKDIQVPIDDEKNHLDPGNSTGETVNYPSYSSTPPVSARSTITKEDSQRMEDSYKRSCELLNDLETNLEPIETANPEGYFYSYSSGGSYGSYSSGEEFSDNDFREGLWPRIPVDGYDRDFSSNIPRTRSENELGGSYPENDNRMKTASESDIRQNYEEGVTPRTQDCLEELSIKYKNYEIYKAGGHKNYDEDSVAE